MIILNTDEIEKNKLICRFVILVLEEKFKNLEINFKVCGDDLYFSVTHLGILDMDLTMCIDLEKLCEGCETKCITDIIQDIVDILSNKLEQKWQSYILKGR